MKVLLCTAFTLTLLTACGPSVEDLLKDRYRLNKILKVCTAQNKAGQIADSKECISARAAERITKEKELKQKIAKEEAPYNKCVNKNKSHAMQSLRRNSNVTFANAETARRNAIKDCFYLLPKR
jgi:hypothetical protein